MALEWLKDIKKTIAHFKNEVPKGRALLDNIDVMDAEKLLDVLHGVFNLEEDAIKEEHKKNFVTDTYENNVRHFAKQLMMSMISNHGQLIGHEGYKSLLGRRHMAYGFYSILRSGGTEGLDIIKAENGAIEQLLYSGLVEFYGDFYGSFFDNQEAIELLCRYYPSNNVENNETVAKALYTHVSNAGTSGDVGFAFSGIELIRKYIHRLPVEIVDLLLREYDLYRIITNKVYRHQIFTIIDHASLASEKKTIYKFSYLDSILLTNSMTNAIYEKYGNSSNLSLLDPFHRQKLKEDKIGVIANDALDSIYAYWTNECSPTRQFVVDGKPVINVALDIANHQISIASTNRPYSDMQVEFIYSDWMLEDYRPREMEQKLSELVYGSNNEVTDSYLYNRLTFSLLFLNSYRAVKEQPVDFEHRFTYDCSAKELKARSEPPDISHFYGEKIHSLSCIVGKNGTGKTSTVDFLRDTFFRLLYLIDIREIPCSDGCVDESDYGNYGLFDRGSEFVIVFRLDDEPYYLTNIKTVVVSGAMPFVNGTYKRAHELGRVVYFSSMLSVHQTLLFTDEEMTLREDIENDKKQLSKSLSGLGQADYSEAASFIRKRKDIETLRQRKMREATEKSIPINDPPTINKDLCYQLVFLDFLSATGLEPYFDMPTDRTFTLKSELLGLAKIELTVTQIGKKLSSLKPYLAAPDAKLEHFSSGQYAKFSFLAKLYWFLEGHRKYMGRLEPLIGPNVFSQDELLQEDETALLFIDEGELYYHPEWQRKYIATLIDFIHDTETAARIQVVITTNSPFMISDVLNEDIAYLAEEKKSFEQTFGQNIHKLLKHNFFMSSTIGDYSKMLIENITRWLFPREGEKVKIGEELGRYYDQPIEPEDYAEKIGRLILKIGEPIYREKLMDALDKSELVKLYRLAQLRKQRDELDREIKQLEEGE